MLAEHVAAGEAKGWHRRKGGIYDTRPSPTRGIQERFIMMRSGNPVLNDNTFQAGTMGEMVEDRMTLMGTVHKTGILLF